MPAMSELLKQCRCPDCNSGCNYVQGTLRCVNCGKTSPILAGLRTHEERIIPPEWWKGEVEVIQRREQGAPEGYDFKPGRLY
jgi:hypothetical protein